MRILGIDYGEKRIGVAISDPLEIIAQGLPTINRTVISADLESLRKIIADREVDEIVIGLPKNMNNTLGQKATEALEFVEALKSKVSLPVHMLDERLSTVMGNKALMEGGLSRKKRKTKVDMVAAQLILQKYLDSRKSRIEFDYTDY